MGNPLPTSSVSYNYINIGDLNAKKKTLTSWGYEDSGNSRIGWSRKKTYNPYHCGYGTFRDQAGIGNRNTIYEQNYDGKITPAGEPNPEVWKSGPWPYAEWPTYVYWWHEIANF